MKSPPADATRANQAPFRRIHSEHCSNVTNHEKISRSRKNDGKPVYRDAYKRRGIVRALGCVESTLLISFNLEGLEFVLCDYPRISFESKSC